MTHLEIRRSANLGRLFVIKVPAATGIGSLAGFPVGDHQTRRSG